jgi:hypothetical protein
MRSRCNSASTVHNWPTSRWTVSSFAASSCAACFTNAARCRERFHVQRVAVIAELPAHVLPRHLHVHPHLHPARAFLQAKYAIRARSWPSPALRRRRSSTFNPAGTDSGMGRAAGSSKGTAFTAKEKTGQALREDRWQLRKGWVRWLLLWLALRLAPVVVAALALLPGLAPALSRQLRPVLPGCAASGSMIGAGSGVCSSMIFSLAVLFASAGSGSMAGAAAAAGAATSGHDHRHGSTARWPWAFAHPRRAGQQHAQRLRRGLGFERIVRSRPCPSGTARGSIRCRTASAARPASRRLCRPPRRGHKRCTRAWCRASRRPRDGLAVKPFTP